jgi:hypothetical protein
MGCVQQQHHKAIFLIFLRFGLFLFFNFLHSKAKHNIFSFYHCNGDVPAKRQGQLKCSQILVAKGYYSK